VKLKFHLQKKNHFGKKFNFEKFTLEKISSSKKKKSLWKKNSTLKNFNFKKFHLQKKINHLWKKKFNFGKKIYFCVMQCCHAMLSCNVVMQCCHASIVTFVRMACFHSNFCAYGILP
jgi:hypothetical protein